MAMTLPQIIGEIPSMVRDLYQNHVTKHVKVIAPTVLHVNVNMRCNTQCAMCNIWEMKSSDALSVKQFDEIFSDPVYRGVEYVVLAGGEATLRHDLPEIVEVMHKQMPKIKKIMLPSNVINRSSIQKQYPPIARYCAEHRIRLTLGVSLDGIGDTHDKIRGVKGAFAKVMENIQFMKELQKEVPFNMSIDPTIFSLNVNELQKLKDLADRLKLPITFQFAAVADDYYHNADIEQVLRVDEAGSASIIEFLERHIAELSLFDALAYYYAEVIEQHEGACTRSLPCPFADQGLLLNPDGSVQYCHNSRAIGNALEKSSSEIYFAEENLDYRKRVWKESCPSCRMSCLFFVSLRKEVFPFLAFMGKRMLGINRLHWRRHGKVKITSPQTDGNEIVESDTEAIHMKGEK